MRLRPHRVQAQRIMARQPVDGALPARGEQAQGCAVQRASAARAHRVGTPVGGAAVRSVAEQTMIGVARRRIRGPRPGAGRGRAAQPGEEGSVVARAFLRVGEHRVGLVDDRGVPVVAAEVGMRLEPLHQRAVARADDLHRRTGLDLQDAVVVAPVLHAPPSLAQPGGGFCGAVRGSQARWLAARVS